MVLGIVAAPGAAADLGRELVTELAPELDTTLPGVRWRLELVEHGLVQPPATDGEVVAACRELLLQRGWDLAVCLTDLPLRVARRPVVAHASTLHGVGLLSVPALGAVGTRRRAREVALHLVETLLGEVPAAGPRTGAGPSRTRMSRRARELGSDVADDAETFRFTARVVSGNLRLLTGMVRANRPWRLAARLSRALTAAGATGVFALITSDVWRLADAYGPVRLTAVAVAAVGAVVATLILGGGLWEHTHGRQARQQVVLFNLATTATVLIGVAALYLVLFVLSVAAAPILVAPDLLVEQLGHRTGVLDLLELAWLTASLATAGGALGAGLETDEAVREAAYAYRGQEPAEGRMRR